MADKTDPKQVASGTAGGIAARFGAGRLQRRRTGRGAAAGAARGAAAARGGKTGLWVTTLLVVVVLVGMLAIMLRLAP